MNILFRILKGIFILFVILPIVLIASALFAGGFLLPILAVDMHGNFNGNWWAVAGSVVWYLGFVSVVIWEFGGVWENLDVYISYSEDNDNE